MVKTSLLQLSTIITCLLILSLSEEATLNPAFWRFNAMILQVHPYTFRNEFPYVHFDFHQDPYQEYEYWMHKICVDGLFTDFAGTLHLYQEWTYPH